MSIYTILPALDMTQSVHAKISIGMHWGVKLKSFRIPLIGLETEAGQIGPTPNRPKVKSAPNQIGPKSNRPQVKSAPVKSASSQIGPIFIAYYCQHARLNSLNTIQQNI